MNILYVYAHPHEQSFNQRLMREALAILKNSGHTIAVSDLYQMSFNPVAGWHDFVSPEKITATQYMLAQQSAYQQHCLAPDIQLELEKLMHADHLIFQFPLWWFSVPAILKGWLDRVLVKGAAYDAGKVFDTGMLKGKTVSFIITAHSPASAYESGGMHGKELDEFLLPLHHTLRFVGIKTHHSFVVYDASKVDDNRLKQIVSSLNNYLVMTLENE